MSGSVCQPQPRQPEIGIPVSCPEQIQTGARAYTTSPSGQETRAADRCRGRIAAKAFGSKPVGDAFACRQGRCPSARKQAPPACSKRVLDGPARDFRHTQLARQRVWWLRTPPAHLRGRPRPRWAPIALPARAPPTPRGLPAHRRCRRERAISLPQSADASPLPQQCRLAQPGQLDRVRHGSRRGF